MKVIAELQTGGPTVRVDRFGLTDGEGRFSIEHLAFGKYEIVTEKASDGYPRLPACFLLPPAKAVIVALTAENPSAAVYIELPPRAGKITGSISNADSGAPVTAGIQITSRSQAGCWIGMRVVPDYFVQVPSGADIDLAAEADRYADWSYSGAFNGAALNVEPGETVVLNIKLQHRSGQK